MPVVAGQFAGGYSEAAATDGDEPGESYREKEDC